MAVMPCSCVAHSGILRTHTENITTQVIVSLHIYTYTSEHLALRPMDRDATP